jgi:hypothetical protein
MSVYIDSLETIKNKLKLQDKGPAHAFLTSECYKAMDRYVPMDMGNLRANVALYPDKIVYESPYASYQYYGMRKDKTHKVKHYTTGGTGPYWDKRMISADIDKVVQAVQDRYGR